MEIRTIVKGSKIEWSEQFEYGRVGLNKRYRREEDKDMVGSSRCSCNMGKSGKWGHYMLANNQ